MRLDRRIAQILGRTTKLRLIRKDKIWAHFEPFQLERFFRHFRVDCVFDVGANKGQYADRLRRLGYDGPIISFEPIPALAERLRRRAARDGNWFVEEIALAATARDATFNVMKSQVFSSLLAPDTEAAQQVKHMNAVVSRIAITTGTLDVYVRRYAEKLGFKRPFLKMDTQGADLEVAKGAGEYLSRFAGLQSELAFTRLYKDSAGFSEALAFYEQAGFRLSALVPNNSGHFPDLLEFDCIMYRVLA